LNTAINYREKPQLFVVS